MTSDIALLLLTFASGIGFGWVLASWMAYRIIARQERSWHDCETDDLSLCKWMVCRDLRQRIQARLMGRPTDE